MFNPIVSNLYLTSYLPKHPLATTDDIHLRVVSIEGTM